MFQIFQKDGNLGIKHVVSSVWFGCLAEGQRRVADFKLAQRSVCSYMRCTIFEVKIWH